LTNGVWIPKFDDIENDTWLSSLGNYLIDNFAKEGKAQDVRQKISKDFQIENIMNLSRVSQIKQMMHKHDEDYFESGSIGSRGDVEMQNDDYDEQFSPRLQE
jgi:hypothetical protein